MKMRKRHLAILGTAVLDLTVIAATAPDLVLAGNVLVVLLMVKAMVFVALYGIRSNWRSTTAGRAVMALVGCIGVICAIGTVNLLLSGYPGRPTIRVIAFTAVGLTLMNLLLTLIEAQRNGEGDP